jgi:hypothetical protein
MARVKASNSGLAAILPRWGWPEFFVALTLLSSGLMFLPGTSSIRMLVRALPYMFSLGLLLLYGISAVRGRLPAGGRMLAAALVLLAINLLHPGTTLIVGLAQWVFQLSIAAPLFWFGKAVVGRVHFWRVLWVLFLACAAHSVIGVLQAIYPARFMPPQLMVPSHYNAEALASMSFVGPFGQRIMRPPGLTDLPGGAAFGAVLAVVLGIGLLIQPGVSKMRRLIVMGLVAASLLVVYLTQIRTLALGMLVVLLAFSLLVSNRREGKWLLLGIGGAMTVGFLLLLRYATADAGVYSPLTRYSAVLVDQGPIQAFMENRGYFFEQTFTQYLPKYAFGAGVGRWGMMREYFVNHLDPGTPPMIWAEVQITGWLLDGGVLMWVFYGGALLVAMAFALRLARWRGDSELALQGAMVFSVQLFIMVTTLGGATFNSQQGMVFWIVSAALYAAATNRDGLEGGRVDAMDLSSVRPLHVGDMLHHTS